MRILNVNFTFNTIGEKLSDELSNLKELQKRGHYIATISTDLTNYVIEQKKSQNPKFLQINEEVPVTIFDIPVYILHCSIPKLAWYCPNAKKIANEIVKNFDVVHIRNWYHHIAIEFYKACIENNIPYVFTAHGTLDLTSREKYMKIPKLIIDKFHTRKMIQNASALQSLGDSEEIEFIKFGASKKKILRIDLGVKTEDLVFDENKLKNELDFNFPYILFLGRIVEKKGIELLFDAFTKINKNNLHIVVAGTGEESYKNELIELCEKLRINEVVHFVGPLYGMKKAKVLHNSKIFALTSYSDMHPVAIIEALSVGIPILITKNCDFPEIEEYDAGVIVNAEKKSVYEGLVKILENDEKLRIQSENAKKLFQEKFRFEDKVEKYEELFNLAIKEHKSKSS